VDALLKLRASINASLGGKAASDAPAAKISVNDLIIKAAALACRKASRQKL
jgi:pyruvate/2-oxoglutarate dehydrogenase complex dihydrolipoamide acyltransferase (E2) component